MSTEAWKKLKAEIVERLRGSPQLVYGSIKKQKPLSNGWVQGLCPFHNDTHPSFGFNRQTLAWCCFVCGKGSVFDFLMASSGTDFKHTLLHWCEKLGIPPPEEARPRKARPPIPERLVEHWQDNLWRNEEILRWLREKRGLNDDILRKRQIGWDPKRERNTIPVRDERGSIGNVRLYNAKKKPKIVNYTEGKWRYGSPARLYGVAELVKDDSRPVLLVEGEWDKVIGEQEGFLAVTSTHGCSVFRPEWIEHFAGRDVVVVYDCDAEGQRAAREIILKAFRPAVTSGKVKSIRNVALPLRGTKDDKDLTDYFVKRGFTAADLQKLIDGTVPHSYEELVPPEEVTELASFVEVERKDLIDKKARCEITVCGETSEAFHAVEEFEVTYCPRKLKGQCYDCADAIKVPRGSREYIGSCMATDVQVTAMLRAFCCRYGQKPGIKILGRTTVKEFFCHQRVNRITHVRQPDDTVVQLVDGKNQELVEKKVYYLSSDHVKPGNYLATGWVKSHPRTQQVTFLIETLIPQEDDFEAFSVEENIDDLRALKRLSVPEIISDLRQNVTRVYKRDEVLLAILLAFLSPRRFWFNGERLRGWLSVAIIGDTGTAKTQTYTRLADFLDIGDVFSGLTGSRTGLAYALVEHKQKGWQVKIGRYPANSRKLLMVDEVQEVPPSQLQHIAKAMDEGFLQIDKVRSKGYESETRLVMLGNPKRGAIMDDHPFGCTTLKAIFPVMMIRRLDFAVFVNANDLPDLSFIREKHEPAQDGKLTKDMLRALVYWSWNLDERGIDIPQGTFEACLDRAGALAEAFGHSTDVPLLTRYECEKTLARVAVAFAVLDGSTDQDFTRLFVKPEHVESAGQFLTAVYSHENCMLDEYSRQRRQREELPDFDDILRRVSEVIDKEKHDGKSRHHFRRLLYALWTSGMDQDARHAAVKRGDLVDMVGCSPQYVSQRLRILKSFSLIESTKNGYVKQPKFMRFFRRLLREQKDFFEGAQAVNGNGGDEESDGDQPNF